MSFKTFLSLVTAVAVIFSVSAAPAKTLMEDVWKYRTLDEAVKELEETERKRGPEHKKTVEAMIIAGNVAMIKNAPVDSVKYFERALAILEKKRGKRKMNARILNVRSSLGQAYAQVGDYTKAAEHLEATLKGSKRLGEKAASSFFGGGEAYVGYMMAHRALADAYYELGEYEKTEMALDDFIDISTKRMQGVPKAQLSQIKSSQIGSFYYGKQDCKRALPYLEEERRAIRAINMPNMAGWLLAECYVKAGRHAEAEPILIESMAGIETQEKMVMNPANMAAAKLGPRHAEVMKETYQQLRAFVYLPMIAVQFAKGDTAAAKNYINRMDRIKKDNTNRFWMSYKMAFIQGAYDDKNIALDRFIESNGFEEEFLEFVYAIPSERTKLLFLNRFSVSYNGSLSFVHQRMPADQKALKFAMAAALNRKGLVFDAQSRANEAIVNSLDPETRELWNELNRLRALYAKLLQEELSDGSRKQPQGPVPGGPPGARPGQPPQPGLKQLKAQIEQLEKKITAKSETAAGVLYPQKVTLEKASGNMPANAALIEIVRIRNYDWTKSKWAGSDNYIAFVLRPDSDVRLVDLGGAAELDETVSQLVGKLTKIPANDAQVKAQMDAAKKLGERIWTPLAEAAGDVDFVVISPDGSLNAIPFGALADADGIFVVESKTVTYISSGRDLIRSSGGQTESDLFLAANPSYDNAASQTETAADSPSALRSVDFSMKFSPLPGTGVEAESVPGLLPGDDKIIVTQAEATERAVSSAKRPRVMHLATHGFFLKDQGEGGQTKVANYENPLVRSGLAFAGANSAMEKQSGDDGLLTALEVTAMDLHGTELVTLSACETASGQVRTGEGVFGLRRAFALAGARNLLMSLWPVADQVTAEQMKTFYKFYGQGRRPAEALRAAQLETIAGLREKFGSAPPSIWAPFILQGAPEKN